MAAAETIGAIGGAMAAAGATASAAGAFTSAYKAYKYNKKLAKWQNEQNLQNWNLANQYNAPSAQIQRLKDAGLNPLYYGLDGSSADAFEAAAAAPYQSPQFMNPFEGMQNIGPMLADIKLKQAQADNLAADTAKKNNENITETQRRANLAQELEESKVRVEKLLEDTGLTKDQRALCQQSLRWNERLNQANLEYSESMSRLNDSQRKRIDDLLVGEKVIQAKTADEFEHRWEMWSAAAAKDRALAGLTQKDIENYALIHLDSGFAGTGFSLRNVGLLGVEGARLLKEAVDSAQGKNDSNGKGKKGGSR